MKHFAQLITELDQTNSTLKKIDALYRYFELATDPDKLWTMALLSHKRPRRTVRTTLMKKWAAEAAGIPFWLFDESYHIVGDLAEAISLVFPRTESTQEHSLTHWMEMILSLKTDDDEVKKEKVVGAWNTMDPTERFVFNKLITGGWRIGVSQKLMVRALARHTSIEENELAHMLMGDWSPQSTTYEELLDPENSSAALSRPYPFYLAYAVDGDPAELGPIKEWLTERKWDGIRGQVVAREGELFVWSRGEELITEKFPEYEVLRELLPSGTVIDGEILPFRYGTPLPFNVLQTRIGRKNVTKKILTDAPVVLVAYDLLEQNGEDLRALSMDERRSRLEELVRAVDHEVLLLSEEVRCATWNELAEERERSRELQSEGIMLKRRGSTYKVGRKKGDWWKWKVEPLTIDAVMIYAQRGHGRRADLFTDFTFAVWNGEQLVPFTKAYSGLTDKEMRRVDAYVKKNTIDRFGPVRSVTPKYVFEIGFEGIQKSTRHKSGVALRFPRILRWREDKPLNEANTLDDLKQLLEVYEQTVEG